ncbi:MAG: hypothetical protein JWP49_1024 [Phenylobacterium sp.]|nr:hypothetical protein [Phenylobacterium sp.]
MIAPLTKALTSPAAGPAASAVAVALAGLLAASWIGGAHREARLQAQVGALAARNEQAGTYWRAQLSSCRAEAATPAPPQGAITRASSERGDEVADRLATQGPAGFDVCARMEAADQAVLASLRAK